MKKHEYEVNENINIYSRFPHPHEWSEERRDK